jgi:tRNA nucleotidyltransferase (CCA-adding enzyme)
MDFYLVGGAVRDRLLGIEPDERDWVVVGATDEEMESRGFRRVDAEFPVFAHPQSGEEYALARRERKTGPGHKGFVVECGPDVTLEEDLRRRDLRLNAIAESESGRLIDPYDGRSDIASRTLRHVSPAFVEDPLRVLRVARFAARFGSLGFTVHPSTLKLMRAMSSAEEMSALSPSRIWDETQKALLTDDPARYFEELAVCGALALLVPHSRSGANAAVSGCSKRGSVLAALAAAAALDTRTEIRFAALAAALANSVGREIIDRLCDRYPVPRHHAELVRLAFRLYGDTSAATPMRAEQLLEVLEKADAFRRADRFRDALDVCRALESAGADVARGRAAIVARAFAAASGVNGGELSRAGLRGEGIARELARRRLAAIENAVAKGENDGD